MSRTFLSPLIGMMLISVIIAVPARAQPVVLTVELAEFRISPNAIEVILGEAIQIRIINNGTQNHTFVLLPYANYDSNIRPSQQVTASFNADTVGTYPMYCVLPGHRTSGMEGTFTIRRVVTTPPLPVLELAGLLVATAVAAVVVVAFLRSRRNSET